MEESGTVEKTGARENTKDKFRISIKRTQSSLELLSNAALAESSGNLAALGEEQGKEDSSAAGSGDSEASARVTPSISQVSFACAGTNAMDGGTNASVENRQEDVAAANATVSDQVGSAKPGGGAASHGFIPSSPYYAHTTFSGITGGADPTGLPIDHYVTYAPAPQLPSYLPDTYISHPTHYYTGSATLLTPRMASAQALNPTAAYAVHHAPAPSLAAAFVPPRSSAVRLPPNEAAAQAHYFSVPPPGAMPVYASSTAYQRFQISGPGFPLGPTDSFQSDSTSSLVSESRLKTAATTARPKSPPQGNPGVESKESKRMRLLPPDTSSSDTKGGALTYEELEASNQLLKSKNMELKYELEKRNQEVAVLRDEVRELDLKVKELRQFPAGKISQIPMADMLEIMQIYGSEISDTVMPPRKLNIQKASVIRQFRRWNPNFLKYFFFKEGKWLPKLGQEGELARRQLARKNGKTKTGSSADLSQHSSNKSVASPVPSEDSSSTITPPRSGGTTAHSSTMATPTTFSPSSPPNMSASGEDRKRKVGDGGNNEWE